MYYFAVKSKKKSQYRQYKIQFIWNLKKYW